MTTIGHAPLSLPTGSLSAAQFQKPLFVIVTNVHFIVPRLFTMAQEAQWLKIVTPIVAFVTVDMVDVKQPSM